MADIVILLGLIINGAVWPISSTNWEQRGYVGSQMALGILIYAHSYNLSIGPDDTVLGYYSDGSIHKLEVTSTDYYLSNSPHTGQMDLLTSQGWRSIQTVAKQHTSLSDIVLMQCWDTFSGAPKSQGRMFISFEVTHDKDNYTQ